MVKKCLCIVLLGFFCLSCSSEDTGYEPTPQPLIIPELFSDNIIAPVIPNNNPQTVEGVSLGKKLFFDTILSSNNTQSCASCHSPQNAFTDSTPTSDGGRWAFWNTQFYAVI